jgi:CubicO group peptidase (beta-lactamase class C family)
MKRLIALICSSFSLHAVAVNVSDDVTVFLKQTMQEQHIPALQVAVIQHNKIVKLDAYGIANVENEVPATRDSVFSINSCTKAFTGVAVMQLVETGKLGIDDPISLYLDDLPAAWRAITIKQVLTHVSGLPNIIDSKENPIGDGSDASAWATVKTLPLEFPAGAQFRYNQTGYVILGKIIDKLSGQPFARFIEERQFRVAGMPHTRFGDSSDVVPHSAGGYSYLRNEDGEWKKGDQLSAIYVTFPGYFRTAAGILSTADDIAHWLIALQSGKLLKQKTSLDVLWTTAILNDGKTGGMNELLNGSALGWPVTTRLEHPAAGPIGGMRSTFFVYPKDDMSVILLTNLQGANPENFADEVAAYYIPEMHASNGFGLPLQIKILREALLRQGFDHAALVYADLTAENVSFHPSEEEINAWAYLLFAQKQPRHAIAILTLNAQLYPESWNVFDSLGEIFQNIGDKDKAVENYRRSLKFNPHNANAIAHLKEMGAI